MSVDFLLDFHVFFYNSLFIPFNRTDTKSLSFLGFYCLFGPIQLFSLYKSELMMTEELSRHVFKKKMSCVSLKYLAHLVLFRPKYR